MLTLWNVFCALLFYVLLTLCCRAGVNAKDCSDFCCPFFRPKTGIFKNTLILPMIAPTCQLLMSEFSIFCNRILLQSGFAPYRRA